MRMYRIWWYYTNRIERGHSWSLLHEQMNILVKEWHNFCEQYPDLVQAVIRDDNGVEWFSIRYNRGDDSTETHTRIERLS